MDLRLVVDLVIVLESLMVQVWEMYLDFEMDSRLERYLVLVLGQLMEKDLVKLSDQSNNNVSKKNFPYTKPLS